MAGTESDILWLISPTRGGRLLWSRQNTLPFGRDFMGGSVPSLWDRIRDRCTARWQP